MMVMWKWIKGRELIVRQMMRIRRARGGAASGHSNWKGSQGPQQVRAAP